MADDCNFEELVAMLDESEEVEAAPANQEAQDSSDDDIGDDELDKLLGVVEESQGDVVKVANKNSHEDNKNIFEKLQKTSPTRKTSGRVTAVIDQNQNRSLPNSQQSSVVNGNMTSPQELADQLRMMQEKVKQLEEQLKGKASQQGTAAPEAKPGGEKQSGGSTEAAGRPKVQLLEEDIFGRISDLEEEEGGKESTSTNRSKQNHRVRNCSSEKKTQQQPKRSSVRDDSDSDWEDMEGEKPQYSKHGEEIKKLLKGSNRRIAHTPKHTAKEDFMSKVQGTQHAQAKRPSPPVSSQLLPSLKSAVLDEKEIMKDPYSGIRIVNPLVSLSYLKARMSDKKVVKMSRLHSGMKNSDMADDWVTIGVVVSKSDSKVSANGNTYSIWRMSDLADCDSTVSFFLFGDTHKTHWKTTVGTVVGFLNPSIMANAEKKKDPFEVSLTVDHPQKLMFIGTAKDLGTCKGTSWKSGKSCSNFVNLQMGEYCTYHVKAAYRKQASKRTELSASFQAPVPKSFEKKLFEGKNTSGGVMYGGRFYDGATSNMPTKRKKNQITVNHLQQHAARSGGASSRVSTATLHEILPEDKKKLQELQKQKADENKQAFLDMLSTPTPGAMNLVKHLVKHENVAKASGPATKKAPKVVSISPAALLKSHQQQMALKRQQRAQQQQQQRDAEGNTAVPKVPTLGRGLCPGDDIVFDASAPPGPLLPRSLNGASHKDLAKARAVARMKAAGGIKKEDPNAVRKMMSPERLQKLKRKVQENSDDSKSPPEENNDSSSSGPPAKKSRLLGGLDLSDPEVQKLLKRKSKHSAQLTEEEEERQEKYFDLLEKKEKMEDKMSSTYKVKCWVVTCSKCKYTTYSQGQRCKDLGHIVKRHEATKRFFQCKNCKNHFPCFTVVPTDACSNCGGSSFVKAAMMREKKGPKLETEELQITAEETGAINSLTTC